MRVTPIGESIRGSSGIMNLSMAIGKRVKVQAGCEIKTLTGRGTDL
jgi:hypothetical protein